MKFLKKDIFIIVLFISAAIIFLYNNIFSRHKSIETFKTKITACLPADKSNFNFEKAVLDLNSVFDPAFDRGWTMAQIDALADGVKAAVDNSAEPEVIMKKFNSYFFADRGYVFDVKANAVLYEGISAETFCSEDFLNYQSIERVIKRKQGICLSLSVLYLIVAERLKLPVCGVIVPGHIFIRYQDGRHSGINSETTFGGAEYYGYKGMTGTEFLDNGLTLYNKCLDNYTVLAAVLNNFSILYRSEKQYEKAAYLLKKSMAMASGFPEPHNNLGLIYAQTGKFEESRKEFEESLKLFPDSAVTQLLVGILYFEEKRYTMAEAYFNRVLKNEKTASKAAAFMKMIKKERGY